MLIRKATSEDLPSILDLYKQPSMDDDNTLSSSEFEKLFLSNENNPKHTLYVGVSNNEVVASFTTIIIQMFSHSGGKMGMIEDIVVKTDLQNKGIGSDIITYCKELFSDLGCYKITIVSGKHREEAHQFFKKHGFELQGYSFAKND